MQIKMKEMELEASKTKCNHPQVLISMLLKTLNLFQNLPKKKVDK